MTEPSTICRDCGHECRYHYRETAGGRCEYGRDIDNPACDCNGFDEPSYQRGPVPTRAEVAHGGILVEIFEP